MKNATSPKPFVFVLMPFSEGFSDIYKFGIKGAAEDAGAYAERLDEQIYKEGMLERIFNQISKADVIVADMTGRNANVFYEVGYAHALGKLVLLLTQKAEDIPFDLQHRSHIVYAGKIDMLRKELLTRIQWALQEAATKRLHSLFNDLAVTINGIRVPIEGTETAIPTFTMEFRPQQQMNRLTVGIKNIGSDVTPRLSHIYLIAPTGTPIVPGTWQRNMQPFGSAISPCVSVSIDEGEQRGKIIQYRLPNSLDPMPVGVVETFDLDLLAEDFDGGSTESDFTLRIHDSHSASNFSFKVVATMSSDEIHRRRQVKENGIFK